jgi:hypothetical protein
MNLRFNKNIQNIIFLQEKIDKIRSGKSGLRRLMKSNESSNIPKVTRPRDVDNQLKPKISNKYPTIYRVNVAKIKAKQMVNNDTVGNISTNINYKVIDIFNKRQRFATNIMGIIGEKMSFAERVTKALAMKADCLGETFGC